MNNEQDKNLTVGNIIFIVDKSTSKVQPFKVVEKVMSETLEGVKVHHIISSSGNKKIQLEKLDVIWFKEIEEVRNHLLKKAEEIVNEVIKLAEDTVNEHFVENSPLSETVMAHNTSVSSQNDANDESVKVLLEDGTVANVKISDQIKDVV